MIKGFGRDRHIPYAEILSARYRIDSLDLQLNGEELPVEIPDWFIRGKEKRLLLNELQKRLPSAGSSAVRAP